MHKNAVNELLNIMICIVNHSLYSYSLRPLEHLQLVGQHYQVQFVEKTTLSTLALGVHLLELTKPRDKELSMPLSNIPSYLDLQE